MPTHVPPPQTLLLLSLLLLTTPTLSFIPIQPFPSSLNPHLANRQAVDTTAAAVAPTTAAVVAPTPAVDTTLPTTAAVIDTALAPAAAATTALTPLPTTAAAVAPTAPAAAPTAVVAPAPIAPGQVSPITTYQVYEYKPNAAPIQVDVVYTQLFVPVPDQWPGPGVGKIGLGKRWLRRGLELVREVEQVLITDEGEGEGEGEKAGVEVSNGKNVDTDTETEAPEAPALIQVNGANSGSRSRLGVLPVCLATTVAVSLMVAGALI